jgi:hypothetical protein
MREEKEEHAVLLSVLLNNSQRREIGRSMPTFGIRYTESVWEIKAIKWGFTSLNSTVV